VAKKEGTLGNAFDLIPDGIVICSLGGRIVDCNTAAVRQSGAKSKWNMIGTSLSSWVAEASERRPMDGDSLALGEPSRNVEYLFRRENCSVYPAEMSFFIIQTGAGSPPLRAVIIRDITQRKKMERELEESRETVRALLNATPDTAYLLNKFGTILAANETGARILGKRDDSIIGLNLFRLIPSDIAHIRREKMEEVYNTGAPARFEDQLLRRFYEISIYPVHGPDRRVTRVALFARDITERKQLEEKLQRYSEHLEDLVNEKTAQLRDAERLAAIGETATMVGHDLRNPLQVIINTIFLARTEVEEAPEDVRRKLEDLGFVKMFDAVDKQVDYMNKIVSDLQDFARETKPRLVNSSLSELILDSTPPSVPETVKISKELQTTAGFFDPYMMKRVMVNLMTNAIQAMPNGGEITIKTFDEGNNTVIKVSDNGVGIPEEFRPKLFKPLSTTKSKGTGMGLAVVKKIVTAHNGTIDVESDVGKGTTFTIRLPAPPQYGGPVDQLIGVKT